MGQVFKKGEDFLFPYYRDLLTALSAGLTAEEILLQGKNDGQRVELLREASETNAGGLL